MGAHDIRVRRERALAGIAGGHALASRYTPEEQRERGQRAAQTRFENKALNDCTTAKERAALLANPAELDRRADVWKRREMALLTEKATAAREKRKSANSARVNDDLKVTAMALWMAARIRELETQVARLKAS